MKTVSFEQAILEGQPFDVNSIDHVTKNAVWLLASAKSSYEQEDGLVTAMSEEFTYDYIKKRLENRNKSVSLIQAKCDYVDSLHDAMWIEMGRTVESYESQDE
jgi:hypothetical protein